MVALCRLLIVGASLVVGSRARGLQQLRLLGCRAQAQ